MQLPATAQAAQCHAPSCFLGKLPQRQHCTAAQPRRLDAAAGGRAVMAAPQRSQMQQRGRCQRVSAYQVEIEHDNGTTTLEVEDGQTILEAALDSGLELSHDCKMGVCMTCPAKLEGGRVDQSAGMLDDDVKQKGYALLCVSTPQSDCKVRIIEEEELLAEVLHGG